MGSFVSNNPTPNLEDLPGDLSAIMSGKSTRRALGLVDAPRETFCGFASVEAVREKLTRLQAGISSGDNRGAYENDFVDAAAALGRFEPAEYGRLTINLKAQGIALGRWERIVRERARQERERIAVEVKAAQAATPRVLRPGSGKPVELYDPEPWDQPVDGALLVEDIAATIRRFVVASQHAVRAVSLWILFSYLIDSFDQAPRLAVNSPVMRCGKSTFVDLLARLACRTLACSNISPAAIFRTIDLARPTLLMDELDSYIRGGGGEGTAEELRGILNSGHTRATAFVIRLVPVGDGCFEPRQFSTFAPIVTAMIGRLPATLRDRAIPIDMKRMRASEKVEPLGGRHKKRNLAQLQELSRRIARWAQDNRDRVAQAEPEPPGALEGNRAVDNWKPLLAIAEVIGAGWPELARAAALSLSGADAAGTDNTLGVKLLHDIHAILEDAPGDEIGSTELCEKLVALELSPWATLTSGRPLTPNRLTRMLSPFEVYPKKAHTRNEYSRADLEDVFERYAGISTIQTSIPPQTHRGVEPNDDSKPPPGGGFKSAIYSTESGGRGGMEVSNADIWRGPEEGPQNEGTDDANSTCGNGNGVATADLGLWQAADRWAGPAHKCRQCGLPVDTAATCEHCGATPGEEG